MRGPPVDFVDAKLTEMRREFGNDDRGYLEAMERIDEDDACLNREARQHDRHYGTYNNCSMSCISSERSCC